MKQKKYITDTEQLHEELTKFSDREIVVTALEHLEDAGVLEAFVEKLKEDWGNR